MRTLERIHGLVVAALAALAGLIFALTTLLIPVNIILRAGFSSGVFGLFDAIEFGLTAATFLAAPWVLARNAHVTVDIGLMALSQRQRRWVARALNVFGAGLCAVFLYYSLAAALASAARGSMVRTSFVYPEWWLLGVVPLSMALMMLEFLLRLRRESITHRAAAGL